jgi:hypothetical protein
MITDLDLFQREKQRTAGGDMAAVCFGCASMSLFGCELEYFERIRRCAWTWQRGYRRWGGLGLTGGDKFHSGGLQIGGAPVRNFAVLAAARAEKQKGRGRGHPGLFIGRVLMAITAINYRGE